MVFKQHVAVVLLVAVCAAGCSTDDNVSREEDKSSTHEPLAETLQTSRWGKQHNGLRCRVVVPEQVEQGMALKVKIELECEPKNVQEGIKKLNRTLYDEHLKLFLKNEWTGQTFQVEPYDPSCGMPTFDDGKETVPLDGSDIDPWKTSFPLVELRKELVPGIYTCRVEFCQDWERGRCWARTKAEWLAAGLWTGIITSGLFRLKILRETPKTRQFLLPTQLRLEKELRLKYGKEDARKVEVPVRNGFFIGCIIYRDGKLSSMRMPPIGPGSDVDHWLLYKGGDKHVTYTIEIFETSNRPVHLWSPGPGSGGYKVLWKKSFELHYSEKEIKALK